MFIFYDGYCLVSAVYFLHCFYGIFYLSVYTLHKQTVVSRPQVAIQAHIGLLAFRDKKHYKNLNFHASSFWFDFDLIDIYYYCTSEFSNLLFTP